MILRHEYWPGNELLAILWKRVVPITVETQSKPLAFNYGLFILLLERLPAVILEVGVLEVGTEVESLVALIAKDTAVRLTTGDTEPNSLRGFRTSPTLGLTVASEWLVKEVEGVVVLVEAVSVSSFAFLRASMRM